MTIGSKVKSPSDVIHGEFYVPDDIDPEYSISILGPSGMCVRHAAILSPIA